MSSVQRNAATLLTSTAYQPDRIGVRKNRTPAHQCLSHALTINHHRRRGARIVVLNSPASSHSRSIGPAPSIVIKSELENTAGWCQKEPNTSPSESVPRTHNQPPSSARRTHRRSEFSCILALPRSIGPAPSIPSSSSELKNPLPVRPVSPWHPTPNPAQSLALRIRPSSFSDHQ